MTALLCLTLLLSGCGIQADSQMVQEQTIELLEPVTSAVNTEKAACRNLYNAKIYSASVFPYTEEYTVEEYQEFAGYAAYPGQQVKRNDALLYANTQSLDNQIESLEESLQTMQKNFQEYREDLLANLVEPKGEAGRLADIVENLESIEPAEKVVTVSGNDVTTEAYANWQRDYTKYEGDYRILAYSVEVKEEELRQRTQLFELDYAYQKSMLERKRAEREETIVRSAMKGEVVALAQYNYLNGIQGNTVVAAVGDMERKVLKCEYINKTSVNSAKDVYALIDGVRCEVTYQPMEAEEYNRLAEENDKVYSTFTLENADGIEVGDFAVIVLISDYREQVLSVPRDSIHRDAEGNFVYVQKDGERVRTSVQTGMTDGVYTEILSGLAEGDEIVLSSAGAAKEISDTVILEKSTVSNEYEEMGGLYYPSVRYVTNTVVYGTVYFEEYLVTQYQQVTKGEVLARVRVVPDTVALERLRVNQQRLRERTEELRKLDAEGNRRAIENNEEAILKVQEEIDEMQKDFAVREIYAPVDGMVINITEHEPEELLKKDAWLLQIADTDHCYVMVDNSNQLLNYGNKMSVQYQDREGNACTAEGQVVNLSNAGVSRNLQSEESLILLPPDVVAQMAGSTQKDSGWWGTWYEVTATIREMEQVVVVPRKAVTEMNGQTYVKVKEASGDIKLVSFLAGGYNTDYYWVVEGLTEGMEVCLE